jgi:hypothetical protein
MTAKIANTGPLREVQSASQLGVAGDVAAIVVMTISLQTEHHRAGKSPLALELPGAHGQLFRSSYESRLRRRGRKQEPLAATIVAAFAFAISCAYLPIGGGVVARGLRRHSTVHAGKMELRGATPLRFKPQGRCSSIFSLTRARTGEQWPRCAFY